MTSDTQSAAGSGTATADLLRMLTEDISRLVRQEIRHAQDELTGKARQAGKGAALLGGAGALGALAAGTSAAVVVRALDRALPRTAAALVATVFYGGGAAALATLGIQEIRRVGSLVPTETVASVSEDINAAASGVAAGRS